MQLDIMFRESTLSLVQGKRPIIFYFWYRHCKPETVMGSVLYIVHFWFKKRQVCLWLVASLIVSYYCLLVFNVLNSAMFYWSCNVSKDELLFWYRHFLLFLNVPLTSGWECLNRDREHSWLWWLKHTNYKW